MAVVNLEITKTSPFANGESFGDVGEYRLLEGTAHFAVDPDHKSNQGITDLDIARKGTDGKVHFSSDFKLIQPANPDMGNGSVLYDVVNRGNVTALSGFNSAPQYDPAGELQAGNGFLMRHGYTTVICGWQADVPAIPGRIGMSAPEALDSNGQSLVGRILCWFQPAQTTQVLMLSDRGHKPHPAVNVDEESATLTVRDHPNSPATPISRDKWSLVRVEDESVEPEPSHIYMESGFEAGLVYELVYTTKGSEIVGLGFAAMRDIVSFLKYADAEAGNPCAGSIQYAHAVGRSQSGRFLRQYLHTGLNEDEEGRKALDGVIAHVAGGMRGEFNLRFGQPSKDVCFIIPELFPFTDTEQVDPVSGDSGSLLTKLRESNTLPKVMFTNTGAEYWRGDAALIHVDLENMADAPEDSDNVRRYLFAGTMHGSGVFPPITVRPADGLKGQLPYNSVDYAPIMRACLENLDKWAKGEADAPESQHPRFADGTAIETKDLLKRFEQVPNVKVPSQPTRAMRLDYGSDQHLGRTTTLPAIEGEEYPAIVSDVDETFNDKSGVRLPYLTVPVATYTGWNLRHPDSGNPDVFIGITGGLAGWTLPLPRTDAEREASSDPRPSIESLYDSKDAYLSQTAEAARALVADGYMLEEDIQGVMDSASQRYDYFMGQNNGG